MTTSTFSEEAKTYVITIDPRVVLIDGQKLLHLMVRYDIGVSTSRTYSVKKLTRTILISTRVNELLRPYDLCKDSFRKTTFLFDYVPFETQRKINKNSNGLAQGQTMVRQSK